MAYEALTSATSRADGAMTAKVLAISDNADCDKKRPPRLCVDSVLRSLVSRGMSPAVQCTLRCLPTVLGVEYRRCRVLATSDLV